MTGGQRRVMNCQRRLALTRLYMTGQIHSRLPGREGGKEGGGQGNVSGRKQEVIYALPVFGPGHVPAVRREN